MRRHATVDQARRPEARRASTILTATLLVLASCSDDESPIKTKPDKRSTVEDSGVAVDSEIVDQNTTALEAGAPDIAMFVDHSTVPDIPQVGPEASTPDKAQPKIDQKVITPDKGPVHKEAGTAPPHDTCANAETLSWTGSKIIKQVDTTSAKDDLDLGASGCTGYETAGKDVFYKIQLPAGSYEISLSAVTEDVSLYVLSSCSASACVKGSDDYEGGEAEEVTLNPSSTTTYIIGVDAYDSGEEGLYTLEITKTGSVTPDAGMPADAGVKPDAPVTTPDAGSGPKVIITEIMANPDKVLDSAGEWFEVYNAGSTSVNLKSWKITDAPGSAQEKHTISTDLIIQPGKYAVLGKSKTGNGGVTVSYAFAGAFNLANSDDEIYLIDDAGHEVDRVEYGGTGWTIPVGASLSLKSIGLDNNNAANWCAEKTAWAGSSGDKGTPGAAAGCP